MAGAPYYVWGSAVKEQNNTPNISVTRPPNLAVDDIMVVAISSSRSQALSFTAGGWTLAATNDTSSGATEHGEIWWRRATSSDLTTSTYQVVVGGATPDWTYVAAAYRGCLKSGTPHGTPVVTTDWTSDKQKSAPGANTGLATSLYDTTTIGAVLHSSSPGSTTMNASSRGWEERGLVGRAGSGTYLADTTHPLPSNLGDPDLYDLTIDTNNNTQATGFAFALKPETPITNSASPAVSYWGSAATSTATTITPVMRASHVSSGDLLIAHIAIAADRSSSLVSNHGYVKVSEVTQPDVPFYHSVWKKIAGSSEPDPTWSYTGAGAINAAAVHRVRTYDTTTPIQSSGTHWASPTGTATTQISVPGADAGTRTNLAELAFVAISTASGFMDRLPDTADVYSNYHYGAAREVGQLTTTLSMGLYWRTFPGPGTSKIEVELVTDASLGRGAAVQLLINSGFVASGEPGRAGFLGN